MVVAIHPLRRRSRRTGLRPLTRADLRRLKFGMLYFGVLRDVDLQCPRCLTVHAIGTRSRRTFNARTRRFRCPVCDRPV